MYRRGEYPETLESLETREFHKAIRQWARIEEAGGPETFNRGNTKRG